MDISISDGLPSTVPCDNCSTLNPEGKKFCVQCSYPYGGTEEEKNDFRFVVMRHQALLFDAKKEIKKARNVIIFLSILFFLVGLYTGFVADDFPTMVAELVLSVLYLVFANWTSSNPFGAILTSFIIYITLIVLGAFVNPASIFSGLLLKIIVIGAFIKGIRSASEAREFLKELDKMKVPSVGYH